MEYVVSAANTLSEEKKEELTNIAVQMKNDLPSSLSPAPFLLVLHQTQDVQEAEKMDEAAFILTDSKETADQLTQDGFLKVSAIEGLGFYLFRKVRCCLHQQRTITWLCMRSLFLGLPEFNGGNRGTR